MVDTTGISGQQITPESPQQSTERESATQTWERELWTPVREETSLSREIDRTPSSPDSHIDSPIKLTGSPFRTPESDRHCSPQPGKKVNRPNSPSSEHVKDVVKKLEFSDDMGTGEETYRDPNMNVKAGRMRKAWNS